MSRFDFEGLTEKTEVDGKTYSYNAPMQAIMECTDDFLDYASQSAVTIKEKMDACEDLEQKAQYQKLYENFIEKAKPPILLFDEITRGDEAVLNSMVKMLSDKSFQGHSMHKARILAACNWPAGFDQDIPADIFIATEMSDVAFYERFEPLVIYPNDVKDRWMGWASSLDDKKQRQNIHPTILKYLEKKPASAYDYSDPVEQYNDSGDFNKLSTPLS